MNLTAEQILDLADQYGIDQSTNDQPTETQKAAVLLRAYCSEHKGTETTPSEKAFTMLEGLLDKLTDIRTAGQDNYPMRTNAQIRNVMAQEGIISAAMARQGRQSLPDFRRFSNLLRHIQTASNINATPSIGEP